MAYIKLVRPHWFLASTLAAMIGIFQAWAEGSYDLLLAVLVIVGVTLHHAIMEIWDELQDYRHYREAATAGLDEPPTLFSGGSGVLTGQLLTVGQVWRFFAATVAVAAVTLVGLIDLAGWQVMICVAVGVSLTLSYNSVLRLSYVGLSDVAHLIGFGPILVCSAYVVLRLGAPGAGGADDSWNLLSYLNQTTLIESAIVGLVWFGGRHVQEIMDYEEDRVGGKMTFAIRFGKERAARMPVATAVAIVALVAYLSAGDPGFLVVLPAAALHLGETTSFMVRWRDDAYFMRKMQSFFVYRNFVLISASILLSFAFRSVPNAASGAALVSLAALAIVSSVPAVAFLARNRLFGFAVRERPPLPAPLPDAQRARR